MIYIATFVAGMIMMIAVLCLIAALLDDLLRAVVAGGA
jgi:hypothetical protein